MLPFMKDKEGAASSAPEETKRYSDREYDLLDAVAEDLLEAVKSGDAGRLRDALESFAEYLMDKDQEQDEQTMGEMT